LTAKSIIARIDREGAKLVVQQLAANGGQALEHVEDKIETGADEWLDVAVKIEPGTTAASREALPIILSRAMTHNPDRVLRMLNDTFKLEDICTVPFIEPTDAQVRRHVLALRSALRRVTTPDLQEKKKACLLEIAKVSRSRAFARLSVLVRVSITDLKASKSAISCSFSPHRNS
jgi:ribosomal protein S8E